MFTKITKAMKYGKQQGGFGIELLYPGAVLPQSNDTGIAGFGRIDHAIVSPGTLIPMHPHIDDEILTYLRSGKVNHLDSEGNTTEISNKKLMIMNAGAQFYHEELVQHEGGVLEGLQIFIRPEAKGLKPQVNFLELEEIFSVNKWRKIAGNESDYPLEIRSKTGIQDMRMEVGNIQSLPNVAFETPIFLFYVFSGVVKVNNDIVLEEGESLLIENELLSFEALITSDVVLFVTDKNGIFYDGGMYSGNQSRLK